MIVYTRNWYTKYGIKNNAYRACFPICPQPPCGFAQLFTVCYNNYPRAWNKLLHYLLLPAVVGSQAEFLRLQMQDLSSSQAHSW